MADTSSRLVDDSGTEGFTVVEFPNLAYGKLADLIEAAKAPGLPSELSWERGARSLFEQAAATWPRTRRLGRRPARGRDRRRLGDDPVGHDHGAVSRVGPPTIRGPCRRQRTPPGGHQRGAATPAAEP